MATLSVARPPCSATRSQVVVVRPSPARADPGQSSRTGPTRPAASARSPRHPRRQPGADPRASRARVRRRRQAAVPPPTSRAADGSPTKVALSVWIRGAGSGVTSISSCDPAAFAADPPARCAEDSTAPADPRHAGTDPARRPRPPARPGAAREARPGPCSSRTPRPRPRRPTRRAGPRRASRSGPRPAPAGPAALAAPPWTSSRRARRRRRSPRPRSGGWPARSPPQRVPGCQVMFDPKPGYPPEWPTIVPIRVQPDEQPEPVAAGDHRRLGSSGALGRPPWSPNARWTCCISRRDARRSGVGPPGRSGRGMRRGSRRPSGRGRARSSRGRPSTPGHRTRSVPSRTSASSTPHVAVRAAAPRRRSSSSRPSRSGPAGRAAGRGPPRGTRCRRRS